MSSEHADGYRRALELIRRCGTPDGFVASPTDSANCHRVWGRDGALPPGRLGVQQPGSLVRPVYWRLGRRIVYAGYVLYDQLLYLQAQRTVNRIHAHVHGSTDHGLQQRVSRLQHLIRANYWIHDDEGIPDDVYHEVLYRKASQAQAHCRDRYWMPFFSPAGYGYRFDAFANVLISLVGIGDEGQCETVDRFTQDIVPEDLELLPAFHPVIEPVDEDWKDLQMTFSYTFKNRPHECHNGGLWPLLTGSYSADLALRNERKRASRFLTAVHRPNALAMGDEAWSFPEYIHGKTLTPDGARHQGVERGRFAHRPSCHGWPTRVSHQRR